MARISLSWGRRKGLVSSSSCRVLGIVALPCSHLKKKTSAQNDQHNIINSQIMDMLHPGHLKAEPRRDALADEAFSKWVVRSAPRTAAPRPSSRAAPAPRCADSPPAPTWHWPAAVSAKTEHSGDHHTFEWMREDFMLRAALTMQLQEADWRSSFKMQDYKTRCAAQSRTAAHMEVRVGLRNSAAAVTGSSSRQEVPPAPECTRGRKTPWSAAAAPRSSTASSTSARACPRTAGRTPWQTACRLQENCLQSH